MLTLIEEKDSELLEQESKILEQTEALHRLATKLDSTRQQTAQLTEIKTSLESRAAQLSLSLSAARQDSTDLGRKCES